MDSNTHFHSQPYLNEKNEYFASNDTIHSGGGRTTPPTTTKKSSQWIKNNEERNEMIMQQNDNRQVDDAQTLTNKTALMMKQFVTCNDGKYIYI
jgi:hypothetical protein